MIKEINSNPSTDNIKLSNKIKIKISDHAKFWQGYRQNKTIIHCCGETKSGIATLKNYLSFLKRKTWADYMN